MRSADLKSTLAASPTGLEGGSSDGTPAHAPVAPSWWHKRPVYLGTAIAQLAILVFGIVSGIVTARLLGPQGRGELAAITLWPMALVYFASLGLSQAIIFHTGKQRHTISVIWTTANGLGMGLSLVVVAFGLWLMPIVLRHYSADTQRLGLIFLIAMPVMLLCVFPTNLFQGKGDLVRSDFMRLIAPGFYALGLVVLLLLRLSSLQAVIGIQIGGYVAALAIGVFIVYRREHPAFRHERGTSRDLLSYGFRTHLANLASYFNQRADQLVLSLLIPADQLGLYAVAATLSMAVTFVPVAAGLVTFSRGSGQSEDEARDAVAKSFRMSLIWLLLACGGLFLVAPILITSFLGPRFEGAVLACRILLPGSLALGLNQVLYGGANAVGKPGLASSAEGTGLLVTVVGLVLLVPRYGYVGAAVVSTIAYTVSLAAMLMFCMSFLHLSPRELVSGSRLRGRAEVARV